MSKYNDGGPAFPRSGYKFDQDDVSYSQEGMSLKDYFAGVALQGMIASAPVVDRTKVNIAEWAEVAYKFANAMLKERNRD